MWALERKRNPIISPTQPAMSSELEIGRVLDPSQDSMLAEDVEGLWRVIIHNDEVTPMEFVVIILQRIFQLTPLEAEHVMFLAHYSGMAYVCTLPLAEAKERIGRAHFAAQLEGFPLLFTLEPN
jgi:ATP-dependent Clp protease adaptor protein ClpS